MVQAAMAVTVCAESWNHQTLEIRLRLRTCFSVTLPLPGFIGYQQSAMISAILATEPSTDFDAHKIRHLFVTILSNLI